MGNRPFLALLIAGAALAQPPITLFEPNGGETYHVGDTMRIRWTADSSAPLVTINMAVDGGESGWWYLIGATRGIGMGDPGWGDTSWVIADSLSDATTVVSTVSSRCLVKIRNYVDGITADDSDSVFTISAPGAVRGRSPRPGLGRVTYVDGVLRLRGPTATGLIVSDLRGRPAMAPVSVADGGVAAVRLAAGVYLVRVFGRDGSASGWSIVPVR
jgi:hypothetical protein